MEQSQAFEKISERSNSFRRILAYALVNKQASNFPEHPEFCKFSHNHGLVVGLGHGGIFLDISVGDIGFTSATHDTVSLYSRWSELFVPPIFKLMHFYCNVYWAGECTV